MYSIDGVALQNPTYGWRLKLGGTNPWAGRAQSLVDFNASGRDGTVQVRGFVTTPTVTLVVDSPAAYVDDLRQLFRLGASLSKTATPTIAAVVDLVSLQTDPVRLAGADGGLFRTTAVLRLPEVYWRDVATTDTTATALTSSGQTVTVYTASTGPIRDALITVKGSVTGLAITASAGTFFSYAPNVPSGTYLTFDAKTGRAWTGGSAFAQTTEVTGSIANGPGPYYLELAGTSSPANLGTGLVVTYTSASGATVQVRARNAYDY